MGHAATMNQREMPEDLLRRSVMFDEFAQTHCAREAVYAALCALVARTPRYLRLLDGAPTQQQRPNLLLAAVHLLVRRAPSALGGYFPSAGGERAVDAAFDAIAGEFIDAHAATIRALCDTRTTQTNEIGRCAVLWPALIEGLRRVASARCALFDFGSSAGLNLGLDLYGLDYGVATVRAGAQPRVQCELRGESVPALDAAVEVVSRLGVDPSPVDLREPEAREWLIACVWPHDFARRERLERAIERAIERGLRVERAQDGLAVIEARVAALAPGVTPVIYNSWVLNYLGADERTRTIERMRALVATRGALWISGEGNEVVLDASHPPCPAADTQWVLHWPGGARVVAHSHPHGAWLRWNDDAGAR